MAFGRTRFKLDEFEYLAASEDALLLRVAGHWSRTPPHADLVATTPDDRLTLETLPQSPGVESTWRAAYSAAADLLDGANVRFELVTPAGKSVPLPQPVERVLGQQREDGDLRRALACERTAREAAERELHEAVRRAEGERARFLEWIEGNAEQGARLERTLSEHHEQLERALATERERAEHALAQERERAETLIGGERERAKRELAALRTELDEARAERADRERRAVDEAARLRSRVGKLEDTVARLVIGVEDGERRLAQAEELAQSLRAAVARVQAERPAAPDLRGMRNVLDRRLERLAHLERQAETLRAAIHERLATQADPGQEQLFEAPVDERHAMPV